MNEYMNIVAKNAARANPEKPGDYRGEDGILRCGKCNGKKEWRSPEGRLFPCSCLCVKQKIEREKKERELEERFNKACSLPVFAELHDKKTAAHMFSEHDGTNPTALKAAKAFVEHWEDVKKRGVGLLFWGGVGTGKTFLSGCIANALMTEKVPALVTSTTRVLSSVSGMNRDINGVFESLKAYDLLVLDDFGAERQSPFALEQITRLIDEWSKGGKPLILSSNITLSDMKNPENVELSRIYDRVMAICAPVKLDGESHRAQQAKENLAWMRSILNG